MQYYYYITNTLAYISYNNNYCKYSIYHGIGNISKYHYYSSNHILPDNQVFNCSNPDIQSLRWLIGKFQLYNYIRNTGQPMLYMLQRVRCMKRSLVLHSVDKCYSPYRIHKYNSHNLMHCILCRVHHMPHKLLMLNLDSSNLGIGGILQYQWDHRPSTMWHK